MAKKASLKFEQGEPVLIVKHSLASGGYDYYGTSAYVGQVGIYVNNYNNGRHLIELQSPYSKAKVWRTFTTSSLAKTKEFDIIEDPAFRYLYV